MVKNLPANGGVTGETGSVPGLGRSPGRGHGNLFQYSCLEKSQGPKSLPDYSLCSCRVEHNWATGHVSHYYTAFFLFFFCCCYPDGRISAISCVTKNSMKKNSPDILISNKFLFIKALYKIEEEEAFHRWWWILGTQVIGALSFFKCIMVSFWW